MRVARTAVGALAVVGLLISLYVVVWFSVFALVEFIGGPASTAAWGLTGALVGISVWMGATAGAELTVKILTYQLASVMFFVVFLAVVLLSVGLLGTLLTTSPELGLTAGLVTAGVSGFFLIGVAMTALWGADSVDDWELFVRLMAASLVLALLTILIFSAR